MVAQCLVGVRGRWGEWVVFGRGRVGEGVGEQFLIGKSGKGSGRGIWRVVFGRGGLGEG